jgi:glutathione peroxidase
MARNLLAIFAIILSAIIPGKVHAGNDMSAHDFTLTSINGEDLSLANFKGKTLLVVNTASNCSFTEQYAPLQALYEEYRDRGLVIIGVPSNDFGGQEPGTETEIASFAEEAFKVDFPLTAKTEVVGPNASPFYAWASSKAGPLGKPRWNFHKYLIGPDGELVTWFSTMTRPDSARLKKAIEATLATNSADATKVN